MSTPDERRISIASGALRLEGAIHDGAGTIAVLVLHPHPQYGGDMDNHVVTGVCAALAARGATTLRFNFRGAGRSEGSYDGGRGEADDADAALDRLRAAAPSAKIVLAGYSFGAMIAAAVASRDEHLSALVLVSPPLSVGALPAIDARLPTLLIAGDRDQVVGAEAVRSLATERRNAVIVEGADHSWWPGLDSLAGEIGTFIDSLSREGATP